MTIPTTPGRLRRVRIWIAAAAVVVTGALGVAGAQAEPHPDHEPTYKATADLDGREIPRKSDVARENFVRDGEWVPIKCQKYGGSAYGSKLWDLVTNETPGYGTETYFVPDRFIETGTDGRAPEIDRCDDDDLASVTHSRLPGSGVRGED